MIGTSQNSPPDAPELRSLWNSAVQRLTVAGVDDPCRDATALLHLLRERETDPSEWSVALGGLIEQRVAGRSIARLSGIALFNGLPFQITDGVYEPCPSSERLLEHALAWAQARDRLWRITDLGTGCGNLLISAALALPQARGIGIDCSEDAVTVAESNAIRLGVSRRVSFVMADAHRMALPPADILLSTLPWLRTRDIDHLRPEVRLHDPAEALDGGRDGLMHLKRLGERLSTWLAADGCAFIQIGYERLHDAVAVFEVCGCRTVETLRDGYGLPMGLRLQR